MKGIDLEKKISVYMFVILVLVFVLIFAWICSSQMKFTVNKILENQTKYEKPTITETYNPNNFTKSAQDEMSKYQY